MGTLSRGGLLLHRQYVDATNLIPRLWHKAAAVAERLWSARDQRDEADAARRLHEFRCLLLTRGINVRPYTWSTHGAHTEHTRSACTRAYSDVKVANRNS